MPLYFPLLYLFSSKGLGPTCHRENGMPLDTRHLPISPIRLVLAVPKGKPKPPHTHNTQNDSASGINLENVMPSPVYEKPLIKNQCQQTSDWTNHLGWRAYGNHVGRQGACNQAPRADNSVFAYNNALEDSDIGTQPYISFNRHRRIRI